MPTHFGRARLLFGSFVTALILSPMLFAQGGHGGAGYSGGYHMSPQNFGLPFQTGGAATTGGHYGSWGGAVVPPNAVTSGKWAFTFGGVNQYGNRSYNSGLGYRRNPPGYIPYYAAAYPFLYSYPYFDNAPPPSGGEAYGPPPQQDQPPSDLMMELDSIHQELAQLKQRQDQSPYGMRQEEAGPVVEQRPSKPTDPPLILVFRDGTRTEVRDFAVVGQMFWDLSGHPTRKYPISQLNLDASIQANEERGVEFPAVPAAK